MESQVWIKHEEKNCPRCKATFVCKVGDVANCQCSILRISEETRDFLSKTQFDCLCKNCLAHFEQLNKVAQGQRFPTQREMFIEGLHYYQENRFWVFTSCTIYYVDAVVGMDADIVCMGLKNSILLK